MADRHYRESIVEHLAVHQMALIDAPTNVPKTYVRARTMFHGDKVRIPKDKRLRDDLIEIQSRPTPNGGIRIVLPRRAGGGHADVVSALVLALWQRAGRKVVTESVRYPRGWDAASVKEAKEYEEELRAGQNPDGSAGRYREVDWLHDD